MSRGGEARRAAARGDPAQSDEDYGSAWVMPRKHIYEKQLRLLMQYFDRRDEPYESDTTFTREHLLELKPEDIAGWLTKKAYGTDNPDIDNGDRPIHCYASTLECSKRAVSYFMPNKDLAWCDGQGDPTKSSLTSKLINDVKRFEARGEGKCGRIYQMVLI